MEENSAAVECLIIFYINMKQVLKTKQVIERVFIYEMIKHCRESGFNKYSDEEIKNTWIYLVSKYLSLKNKGTTEEKENWKYFEILDSCYEQSDFHNGMYPKFSDEMVWFLIECFLKRKALKKTQKQSSIVNEIHKEFLQCGYLYVTKQDIENKWRNLNIKYEKFKNDPESLKKWPYLQALSGFHQEDGRHIVNMIFTRDLTEILIERFTEKKITCVIRGYDSDQVLSEIQSEFKDLGFFFTKDDIKGKWRKLTNVYKFLILRGGKDTSWVYFNALRNHFKEDFLFPRRRMNEEINKQNESKPKRLRQRSKSVGPELMKRQSIEPSLVVQLQKVSPPPKLKLRTDKSPTTKNKSTKRFSDGHTRSKSRKKFKIHQSKEDDCEEKKQLSEILTGNTELFHNGSKLRKLSFDINQERRDSADLSSPTSQVHIINIDHSDIDRDSGNLTINLPSITKQFSDNEFLPLKKRLRTEGDNTGIDSKASTEIKDGFFGFPPAQTTTRTFSMDEREDKRLTEEDMVQIMERISRENSQNYGLSGSNMSLNYGGPNEFNNYQSLYGGLGQQCVIVPKEEHPDSLPVQSYGGPSAVAQPPVLLLVIKVDGNSNPSKESAPMEVNPKMEGTSIAVKDNPKQSEKKVDSDKEKSGQTIAPSQTSDNFVKPISPKGKTIIISKRKNLVPLGTNCTGTSVISDVVSSQINRCNSNLITDNEQVTVNNAILNNGDGNMRTGCENVKICGPEKSDGQFNTKNSSDAQTTDEVIFREPLAVGNKINISTKLKKTDNITENNVSVKPPTSAGRIRLPVKVGGKLKEIFISPRELNKITKWKPQISKDTGVRKPNEASVPNVPGKKTMPAFKFVSQVIKPANQTNENVSDKDTSDVASQSVDQNYLSSKFLETNSFTHGRSGKNEEFENESILSEAVGDDDGLKDNLLATVIDFQEQNNQEFIEIKNLMKQNNLLQRETNRLLRLLLEKQ